VYCGRLAGLCSRRVLHPAWQNERNYGLRRQNNDVITHYKRTSQRWSPAWRTVQQLLPLHRLRAVTFFPRHRGWSAVRSVQRTMETD